jgi:hypothetical protein
MARRATAWKYWAGLATLGAISVTLAVGWWLDHQARSVELHALSLELSTLRSQIDDLPSRPSVEHLRAENDDLMRFIDDVYSLLKAEGIYVQLDLEVDQDGRLRLRADSMHLMEELRAKLRELKE